MLAPALFACAFLQREGTGLEVMAVVPDSVCARAHIKPGDVIVAYDGKPVSTPSALRLAVRNTVKRGVINVKLKDRSVVFESDQLGAIPKCPSLFGAAVLPALIGEARERLRLAWNLAHRDRISAGRIALELGQEELVKGNRSQGLWLKLVGIRATVPPDYAKQLDGLLSQVQAATDIALTAEILNDRYWKDPQRVSPKGRSWWHRALITLREGGYPISAAIYSSVFYEDSMPAGPADERLEMRRYGLRLAQLIPRSQVLQGVISFEIGRARHWEIGGKGVETRVGVSSALEAARLFSQSKGALYSPDVCRDLTWGLRTDVAGKELAERDVFPSELYEVAAFGMASFGSFCAFQYSQAEALAIKSIDLRKKVVIPKGIRNDYWPLWDAFVAPYYVLVNTAIARGDIDGAASWLDAMAQTEKSEYEWANEAREWVSLALHRARKDWGHVNLAEKLARQGGTHWRYGDKDFAVPYLVDYYIENGRLAEAERLLAPAIKDWGGPYAYWLPQAFTLLGDIRQGQGKKAEALDAYNMALESSKAWTQLSPVSITALARSSSMMDELGDPVGARAGLLKALDLGKRFASLARGELSRQFATALVVDVAGLLVRHYVRDANNVSALGALEDARGLALASMWSYLRSESFTPEARAYRQASESYESIENKILAAEGTAEEARRSIETAKRLSTELQQFGLTTSGLADVTELSKEIAAAESELEELRLQLTQARVLLEQTSAAFLEAAGTLPMRLNSENALSSLPPNTAVVTYSPVPGGLIVIVGSRDGGLVSETVKLEGKPLQTWTEEIFQELSNPKLSIERIKAAASRGYRILFPDKVRAIARQADSLVIIPDGPLWRLPFAALQTDQGDWLGTTKPITYALSLTTVQIQRNRVRSGKGALVLGDPAHGRGESALGGGLPEATSWPWGRLAALPALPGSRKEALAVAKIYGTEPLLGEEATERAVRERISAAKVVHLAAHGYMSADYPLTSGVVLAGPANGSNSENDGVLQAAEIGRRLSIEADLVVLSACDTGRGRFLQGEGVQGLVRSFTLAGAKNVVASQWKVADSSTAELMEVFHSAFSKGQSASGSLRHAMKTLSAMHPQPYYWAPFAAYGSF